MKDKKGGTMRNIALVLIAVVALMVIGCQPPEGMAGITTEQFNELKTRVETLEENVANLHAALDSLTTHYNMHIEKFHKGGTTAPKPPAQKKPLRVGG
jgi:outer membrane murein-binding lipoprotein Lpp